MYMGRAQEEKGGYMKAGRSNSAMGQGVAAGRTPLTPQMPTLLLLPPHADANADSNSSNSNSTRRHVTCRCICKKMCMIAVACATRQTCRSLAHHNAVCRWSVEGCRLCARDFCPSVTNTLHTGSVHSTAVHYAYDARDVFIQQAISGIHNSGNSTRRQT